MIALRQRLKAFGRRSAALGAAVVFCGSAAPPPLRLALIIGNGSYAHSVPLPNAPSDAGKIATRLARLGFQVEPETTNLNRRVLLSKLAAFSAKLRQAGPNVIGFFYFAGHAAQSPSRVNYLMPVDAQTATPNEVQTQGVPMQALLEAMQQSNNTINIVVLDSCRDWFEGDHDTMVPKGLHDMGEHGSILIAYAVRPGDTADEGANLESSPFSRRLIEALDKQPRDPIVLLLDDVKSRVYQDSDSNQMPFISDGLTVSGRWSLFDAALAGVANKPLPAGAGTRLSSFLEHLDRKRLVVFFRGHETLVDALLKRRDVLEKYEINTPLRLAHFLAQIGHESGGFSVKEEKFGYSAAHLRRLFGRYVTTDEMATRIAGHPDQVANVIYARSDLGNGPPESGDGWRYRGRGPFGFFLTGKGNYRTVGERIGVDLVKSPDLASDAETEVAISAALWSSKHAGEAAQTDNLAEVTRRLMGPGALASLHARSIWLSQAKAAVN